MVLIPFLQVPLLLGIFPGLSMIPRTLRVFGFLGMLTQMFFSEFGRIESFAVIMFYHSIANQFLGRYFLSPFATGSMLLYWCAKVYFCRSPDFSDFFLDSLTTCVILLLNTYLSTERGFSLPTFLFFAFQSVDNIGIMRNSLFDFTFVLDYLRNITYLHLL